MKKRRDMITSILLVAAVSLSSGCAASTSAGTGADSTAASGTASGINTEFTSNDLDAAYDEQTAVSVTLKQDSSKATGEGVSIEDNIITITKAGTYVLSGQLTDGRIVVDAQASDKIQLVFNGVTLHCETGTPVYVKQADKVFLTLPADSVNAVSDSSENELAAESESDTDATNVDAAIFSKDDLTINGTGSLSVTAVYQHAIVSKDDLTITGGIIDISSVGGGLYGKDCVKIKDGTFTMDTGTDAIQSSNTEDTQKGYVYIAGGTYDITAGHDGIQAETVLQVDNGTFKITTGGGSQNASTDDAGQVQEGWGQWDKGRGNTGERPKMLNGEPPSGEMPSGEAPSGEIPSGEAPTGNAAAISAGTTESASDVTADISANTAEAAAEDEDSTTSEKGFKAGTSLIFSGKTAVIDSSDDSMHSNGELTIYSGNLELTSGDDGIHADSALTIESGGIQITKSYEGIEGNSIDILGGDIVVTAKDDGLNAAGGNDSSSANGRPGENSFDTATDSYIRIAGGNLTVNASGDGIDSNGNLYVDGGITYVSGPTDGANGTLDYAGSAEITGGTFFAAGSTQMAQGFSETSSQYSILHNFASGITGGSTVAIMDANGNEVAAFTPEKDCQSLVISTPELKKDGTYTITAGSLSEAVTLSSVVTSNGGGMSGKMPKDNMNQ